MNSRGSTNKIIQIINKTDKPKTVIVDTINTTNSNVNNLQNQGGGNINVIFISYIGRAQM